MSLFVNCMLMSSLKASDFGVVTSQFCHFFLTPSPQSEAAAQTVHGDPRLESNYVLSNGRRFPMVHRCYKYSVNFMSLKGCEVYNN